MSSGRNKTGHKDRFFLQEACDFVTGSDFFEFRFTREATLCGIKAAACKTAGFRQIDGGSYFSLQNDSFSAVFKLGHRNRTEQSLCVRVGRCGEKRIGRGYLNDFAQIHDSDII